jgi:2-oxoglutarate ferredoxin oxidoreductase subunit gamma
MEIEIMFTGIGGQGVQLAAEILAQAAAIEARQVMCLGVYGGTMRGGNTDSTVVIADAPISAPPIVSFVASALAMHHAFWKPIERKLRPGAVVVLNASVFEGEIDSKSAAVFEVPATEIATELGAPLAASLVLLAAYVSLTGIVKLESLVEAMSQTLPSYRRQFFEANERALRAGFDALRVVRPSVWGDPGVSI